jgi:hypothetical protein
MMAGEQHRDSSATIPRGDINHSGVEVDSYNPYLHGPSRGDYVKSLLESTLPPALVAPDLIKISAIPTKKVYDFTKRS